MGKGARIESVSAEPVTAAFLSGERTRVKHTHTIEIGYQISAEAFGWTVLDLPDTLVGLVSSEDDRWLRSSKNKNKKQVNRKGEPFRPFFFSGSLVQVTPLCTL